MIEVRREDTEAEAHRALFADHAIDGPGQARGEDSPSGQGAQSRHTTGCRGASAVGAQALRRARWRAAVALFDAGRCPVAEITSRACTGSAGASSGDALPEASAINQLSLNRRLPLHQGADLSNQVID
jgi:hypothetical protein